MSVSIAAPHAPAEIDTVRTLFREYAEQLGFSLAYQDFDAELAGLPGKYAPPDGALLVATVDGATAGVVALRKMAEGICEMKRLYVRPAFKGRAIGRALAEAVVQVARDRGYLRLRLDTIGSKMLAAVSLYRSMGFVSVPPYYPSPMPDTLYMELVL